MTERRTIDAVVLDIGGVLMDWDPRHLFERIIDDDVQANVDAARSVGIDAELFTAAGDLRVHLVERGVLRP